MKLSDAEIRAAVKTALAEDLGSGDVTSLATLPATATFSVVMRPREPMVLAGLAFAETAFRSLSSKVRIKRCARDGQQLKAGAALLKISGPARAILSAERVALNFVQRLSGVASLTAKFVAEVKDTRAQILDTRKTTPGWRRFEKYAVQCGGGRNHRLGLFDLVLIKDNHIVAAGGITQAVRMCNEYLRGEQSEVKIEVETKNLTEVQEALQCAGIHRIMLDNFQLDEMRKAVELIAHKCEVEASGGVTLQTVRSIAETGVDFISVGALTHSVKGLDISLELHHVR